MVRTPYDRAMQSKRRLKTVYSLLTVIDIVVRPNDQFACRVFYQFFSFLSLFSLELTFFNIFHYISVYFNIFSIFYSVFAFFQSLS